MVLSLLATILASAYGTAAASSQMVEVRAAAPEYRTVSGTVIPFREVTLSAQTAGRVVELTGAEGDRFEQDELLARISDDRLLAQRRAAMSEMRVAEAAINEARMQYGREMISPQSRSLGQMPGMGMPSMFDQMFTRPMGQFMGFGDPSLDRHTDLYSRYVGVDQAQARWEQARARVEELDAAIRETRSEAPFDGLLMRKHVEPGDTVQPGQPLVTFGYVDYLRIEAQVPVRLVAAFSEGDVVPARLDAGGTVQARVSRIFPMADPRRHTVTVQFDLPRGVSGGPGMHVSVGLPSADSAPGHALIPQSALIPGGALPRVAVVDGEGQSRIRAVRLGAVRDGEVVVTSGLEPGEYVLLQGERQRPSHAPATPGASGYHHPPATPGLAPGAQM